MLAARKIAFALFAVIVAGVILLRLGNVALAGLFSFMILDLAHRQLVRRMPEPAARALAVLSFLVIAVVLAWMFGIFLRLALARMPLILGSLIPRLDSLVAHYGMDLPFENIHELRTVILEGVKEHATGITEESGLLTKGFFQILLSVFSAILCFLGEPSDGHKPHLADAVSRELAARVRIFMQGFEKIFGAQILVSFINTGITAIYLLVMGFPYIHFLTLATFILGVLPVIGNVLSNTIIVGTALAVSPHLALVSLAFLVVSHKLQYVLSGHILGSRMNMPVWQILLGLLVGEAVMGVPGIILAPAVLHYVREELRALPEKAR